MSEPNWGFIEKHAPGARAAWTREVGLKAATIGVTGKPLRAVAWVLGPPLRYWKFDGERWIDERPLPVARLAP